MKVLFNCNNSAFQAPGGGEILLLKTKEFLTKNGIKTKLFNQWEDKLKDYNILHNFGLSSNCFDLIKAAYNKKINVAITTIYSWPSLRFALRAGINLKLKLSLSGYSLLHGTHILNKTTNAYKMLKMASIILTDSKAGKNVLTLIKIASRHKLPLLIIGSSSYQGGNEYYKLCKKFVKKNIIFIDKIDHDGSLLSSAYAAAKAVVLPSWLENPGLSVLEGGLAGANVLVTSRGSAREYFEDYASYINPFDNKDIERKLLMVYKKEKDKELSIHIKKKFIWEVVTNKIKEAYNDLA